MLLTIPKLCDLNQRLDSARRESTGPGFGCYCTQPNVGPNGKTTRFEPKPGATHAIGHRYPNGDELIEEGGYVGIRVSLGVHGRAHLGIDPATGEVRCAKCEEGR
jgi:hypothetical protein